MKEIEAPEGEPHVEDRPDRAEEEEEAAGREAVAALRTPDPPEMFAELAERGLALLEEGRDLAGAQAALERAAAIHPDDAEIAYALGVIYGLRALDEIGRASRGLLRDQTAGEALLAKAIFCYQRAIELDGRRAEPWNNLAMLYALRGDRGLAIEALKRSLQVAPDQPEIRERLEELGAF